MTPKMRFDGPDREALREIAEIAGNLVAGNGGPARYRKPASGLSADVVYRGPQGDLDVRCLPVPHGPLAAMAVCGFITGGFNFERRYWDLGIGGNLIEAYHELVKEFGMVHALDLRTGTAPQLPGEALREALAGTQQKSKLLTFTIPRPALPGTMHNRRGLGLPERMVFPALPQGGK